MTKIFFLPFIVVLLFACSQNSKSSDETNNTDTDTTNTILLSHDGIGEVKIDMSHEELEKVLNKKVPLANDTNSMGGSSQDSIKINYKGVEMELDFNYRYSSADTFPRTIKQIRTNSSLCRTQSGIRIGSDQSEIVKAYKDYYIIIYPGLDAFSEIVNPNESTLVARVDVEGAHIVFFMRNKKVIGYEISEFWDDSE